MTMCAGCATYPGKHTLPPAPAYMAPVAPPKVSTGDDARLVAGKALAGLNEANKRIVDGRSWYDALRKRFK